jgi:hypothetical protein
MDMPKNPAGIGRGRRALNALGAIALLGVAVYTANYFLVGRPVANALDEDSRNEGYTIKAHLRFYVDPTTLVLDLTSIEHASPADLIRGLLNGSAALHKSGRRFNRVILARSHNEVLYIEGDDFEELARESEMGENPVYLVRTLPEKLHKPDGRQAFGSWSGGLLGVVARQMEDVNAAAHEWATGEEE